MDTRVFTLIATFLPIVKEVVKMIEGAATGSVTGPEKKARALELLGAIYRGLQNTAKIKEIQGIPYEFVSGILDFTIDSVVSLFNAIGLFTKSK